MGFAASVSSSAASGFLSASSAFARSTTPWLAPLAGWLQRGAPLRGSTPRKSPKGLQVLAEAPCAPAHQEPRPLRVLRVADGASRQCAGRMVISGRMADVCAELDRLAAREVQRLPASRAVPAGNVRHTVN